MGCGGSKGAAKAGAEEKHAATAASAKRGAQRHGSTSAATAPRANIAVNDGHDDSDSSEDEESSSEEQSSSDYDSSRDGPKGDARHASVGEVDADDLGAMELAARHLVHRHLASGFGSWCEFSAELSRLRAASGRLRHRESACAFATWVTHADEYRLMKRVVKDLTHARLARSLRSWVSAHDAEREERKLRKQEVRRMKRAALQRMRHRGVAQSWLAWVEYAVTHREAIEALHLGFATFRNHALHRVWVTWHDFSAASSEAFAKLGAAVHFMRTMHARRAWRGWIEYVRQRATMRKVLAHARNLELSRGLGTWCELGPSLRLAFLVIEKARLMFRRRSLRTGIASWREYNAFYSAARHMHHQGLSKGWRTWTLMANQRAAALVRLKHAMARFIHQSVAMAFASWRASPIFRKKRPEMGGGSWFAQLFGGQTDAKEEIVMRSLNFMRNHGLSRGYIVWHTMWDERRMMLLQMRTCVARMLHHGMSRGFRQWHGFAEERLEVLQTLRQSVGRMTNRRLATTFATWLENTEFLSEVHELTLRSVALASEYLVLAACGRAFIHWQEEFAEKWWGRFLMVLPPNEPRRPNGRPYRRRHSNAMEEFLKGKTKGAFTGPVKPPLEPRRYPPWKEELPPKPKPKVVKPRSMPRRRYTPSITI